MTEATSLFRVVLRGYDPAQVERRIGELTAALHEAARQRDDLAQKVLTLEDEKARQAKPEAPPAGFDHLGARIGQILTLAEQEAADIRRLATDDAARMQDDVAEKVRQIKDAADRDAAVVRREVEAEAARLLDEARRAAGQRIEAADRDASARIQEAEAVYEEQRARSAKVAADLEASLASRRKTAEAEITQRSLEADARLDQATRLLDEARARAERIHAEAAEAGRRLVEDAELRATTIVNDAKALASRVRADSDRELAAATQRRDSINAQLANVRQMLATLTGTAVVDLQSVADAPLDPRALPGQTMPGHDQVLEAAD